MTSYGHGHGYARRRDHGGEDKHDASCPCCGGYHRHHTYFRETLTDYEKTDVYKAYRRYVDSYKPLEKPRPKEPTQPTQPDCPALTADQRYIRKSTQAMTADDWDRFRDAWLAMAASSFIGQMVEIHDMTIIDHRMHGGGIPGRRFLPWHRVFLLRLEEELHRADPCAILPYWDWDPNSEFPSGIRNFLPPIVRADGTTGVPTRGAWSTNSTTMAPPAMPPPGTESAIVTAGDYAVHFALNQGAHDTVHVRVGGWMASIPTAPADPVFWMHHANADRMWHVWQQGPGAGAGTGLVGADAVMDPWTETDVAVLDIANLGYTYL